MNKIVGIFLVVLTVLLLASCATSDVSSNETQLPDEWWNGYVPDTEELHYEIGYAKGADYMISRDWAKANARSAIAVWVSSKVTDVINTYTNNAGEVTKDGNNMQAMRAFEDTAKQVSEASLTGVVYIKFQEMADGTVFVLAAVPKEPIYEELRKKEQETFVKNGASVEANKMMNEAMDKNFN